MQGPADVVAGGLEQIGAHELVEDVLARGLEEEVDKAGTQALVRDCLGAAAAREEAGFLAGFLVGGCDRGCGCCCGRAAVDHGGLRGCARFARGCRFGFDATLLRYELTEIQVESTAAINCG